MLFYVYLQIINQLQKSKFYLIYAIYSTVLKPHIYLIFTINLNRNHNDFVNIMPVVFVQYGMFNEQAHQTNQRTWAESQWIVATKATLPLTIPRSNSSRLHAIYPLCLSLIIRP